MELNGIYLIREITDLIFDKLNHKDKVCYSQINHYTNIVYKKVLKDSIFKYINVEYSIFFDLFSRYKYNSEEINLLKEKAIYDINPVTSGIHTYYDLRFIFELVYKYNCIFNNYEFPKNKSNIKICIENIKKNISFNRYETLNNINNNGTLYPLTYRFKPLLYKTRENNWTHLFQ